MVSEGWAGRCVQVLEQELKWNDLGAMKPCPSLYVE
jgi:hypothetical protein